MRTRSRPAREGGFSMLIVLILLIMLVGVAMLLLATSRADVTAVTSDREHAVAFYAAEAGVAHGKAIMGVHPWSDAAHFTALIGKVEDRAFDYKVGGVTIPVRYRVAFLNNAENGASDGGVGGPPDTDDTIVIRSEGFGPNNSRAVIEVGTGLKERIRTGCGQQAQANPQCGRGM